MAKKLNKVSVAAWERIAKECAESPVAVVDWHGEQLKVRRRLGLAEMAALVNKVVTDCFGSDLTEYHPEAKRFATARGFLYFYSNITLPVNVSKQYELISSTDIYDTVLRVVDKEQYTEIMEAIEEKIESLLDYNTKMIDKKLSELSEAIDQFSSIFEGISSEDLAKISSAMVSGKLDEEKLMRAYLTEQEAAPQNKEP